MVRPQSSVVGLGSGALDLYSANKLRKISSEFSEIHSAHLRGQEKTLAAIDTMAELQVASMHTLREMDTKLNILSTISWDIASYFDRQEAKEDFIGNLKLILIQFEDALDEIEDISSDYLEYASYQVEILQTLVKRHDVRIEHFKTLPPSDIKWAKSILNRIENNHSIYFQQLRD